MAESTLPSLNEIPIDRYRADILTSGEKLSAVFSHPATKGLAYIVLPAISIAIPYLFPVAAIFLMWVATRKPSMIFPGRMPKEMGGLDKTDPGPGGRGFRAARGEVYLGNHRGTGKECWISWSDLLTHVYGLGATGSGKTEAIWSLYMNFLCAGSGFSIGDGKGTLEFIRSGAVATRRFGVDDDYFVINYATAKEKEGLGARNHLRLSNNINPFSEGTAANLKELFASLALSGDAGQNQYFEDNAAQLIERTFPALVELRDKKIQDLNILAIGKSFPLDGLYALSEHPKIEQATKNYIKDYLNSIGFNFNKAKQGEDQGEEVTKMHSQFTSHFNKIIASLSVQYKDIYMVDQGEVSMKDITTNRRVLIFTLPSLEKSGAELQVLGKILITSQKNAVSIGLGDRLEGTREQSIEGLPSSHKVPYGLAYDEWAFYSIPDMAMLPAQIRGIYFSAGFFAQDYAGTTRGGEMDAEQIFANTRVKLFGSIEETGQTWEKFRALIGEVRQAVHSRYKYLPGMFGDKKVIDRSQTEIITKSEIEIQQMQAQVEGEFYLAMRGRVSPISFYYTGLQELDKKRVGPYKIIRLLRTYAPSEKKLAEIKEKEGFLNTLFSENMLFQDASPAIRSMQDVLSNGPQTEIRTYLDALSLFAEKQDGAAGVFASNESASQAKEAVTSTVIDNSDTSQKTSSTETGSGTGIRAETETETETEIENHAQEAKAQQASAYDPEKNESSFVENAGDTQDSMISSFALTKDSQKASQTPAELEHNGIASSSENETIKANEDEHSIRNNVNYDDIIQKDSLINSLGSSSGNLNHNGQCAELLSKDEAQEILEYSKRVMRLLGEDINSINDSASATLSQLNDLSFYIKAPLPAPLPVDEVNNLDERINRLINEKN